MSVANVIINWNPYPSSGRSGSSNHSLPILISSTKVPPIPQATMPILTFCSLFNFGLLPNLPLAPTPKIRLTSHPNAAPRRLITWPNHFRQCSIIMSLKFDNSEACPDVLISFTLYNIKIYIFLNNLFNVYSNPSKSPSKLVYVVTRCSL